MKYDSSQHHRCSIRLKGYDYSQAGAYETIIRDRQSWDKIRGYILNNPIAWDSEASHLEKYHPHPAL